MVEGVEGWTLDVEWTAPDGQTPNPGDGGGTDAWPELEAAAAITRPSRLIPSASPAAGL